MKKILVIATGGTIASKEKGNGLEPEATGEELLAGVPDLPEGCRLDTVGEDPGYDSGEVPGV